MNCSGFIGRLLAVFVTLGLIFAPLAVPAIAKPQPVMSDMDAAASDMPCCPEQQNKNTKSDCPDCPLIAMCALKTAQIRPMLESGIAAPSASRDVLFVLDDWLADSLGSSPPEHPPRTLV